MSALDLDLIAIKARLAEYSRLTDGGFDANDEAHQLAWDVPALVARVEELESGVRELRAACHLGARANPCPHVQEALAEVVAGLERALGGSR